MPVTALCMARSGERAEVGCENTFLSHFGGSQPVTLPSALPSLSWT